MVKIYLFIYLFPLLCIYVFYEGASATVPAKHFYKIDMLLRVL